jgi:hypothetical protein
VAQPVEKHVRASERRRPRTDGRSIDVEIAHNEKLLRDLATGMRNLRQFSMRDFDYGKRELEQAAKIRSVEAKLFKLRQGRLL